jgi:hypothetical protein
VEAGEIAFLKHTTVDEMTSNRYDFSESFFFYACCYAVMLISDFTIQPS